MAGLPDYPSVDGRLGLGAALAFHYDLQLQIFLTKVGVKGRCSKCSKIDSTAPKPTVTVRRERSGRPWFSRPSGFAGLSGRNKGGGGGSGGGRFSDGTDPESPYLRGKFGTGTPSPVRPTPGSPSGAEPT